jgi:DNA-binding GntR family transcriptional regulator
MSVLIILTHWIQYGSNAILLKGLQPVSKNKYVPIREKTYQYLKSSVLSGQFGPGGKLNQEQLAEELQVSRTPIREALHRLEAEGLIEGADTGGFRVMHLSADELEELFDIRSVLEGFSVRCVCKVISVETIDHLERLVDKSQEALGKKQADEIFHWNTRLHDTIHRLIEQRRRFYSLITNMRDYILRYRKDTLLHLDLAQKTIEAHRKILFAFRLKDPNLAEYMMRLHIQQSKEDAMKITFGPNYRERLRYPDAGVNLTNIVME